MDAKQRYQRWLDCCKTDAQTYEQLLALEEQPELLEDCFYTDLEFGTAGLRATRGVGSNRINSYVVARATQGLCNFLLEQNADAKQKGVAIAYDSRILSKEFATTCAKVLAANDIAAYLYDGIRSVPQLSFTVRHLGCAAGIVITASHNPPAYNGYKVFDATGCQLSVADSMAVTAHIERLDLFDDVHILSEEQAKDCEWIHTIGEGMDEAFYAAISKLCLQPIRALRKMTPEIRVVYTPLHGCGLIPVEHMLHHIGVDVCTVAQQREPDGNFPTVEYPNPEDPAAFALAMELGKRQKADLLLATDPDSDRLGAAVWDGKKYVLLSGNQIGCLLLYYKLEMLSKANALPNDGVVVRSVVSSPLCDAIATAYGVECKKVLTGFRYIGEVINRLQRSGKGRFLFGYEESYGFLLGDHVRDKDAVGAAMMLCEMAAYYNQQQKNILDVLQMIYQRFGVYRESVGSFTLQGKQGMQAIASAMKSLREQGVEQICGAKIVSVEDYQSAKRIDLISGQVSKIDIPVANMLRFELENGWSFFVRPSGTEPKLKFYVFVCHEDEKCAIMNERRFKAAVESLIRQRLESLT